MTDLDKLVTSPFVLVHLNKICVPDIHQSGGTTSVTLPEPPNSFGIRTLRFQACGRPYWVDSHQTNNAWTEVGNQFDSKWQSWQVVPLELRRPPSPQYWKMGTAFAVGLGLAFATHGRWGPHMVKLRNYINEC